MKKCGLYAYDLTTGRRDSVKDVGLESIDSNPSLRRKIWSDGRDTLWVLSDSWRHSGQVAYVYAYDWPSGSRVPAKDWELDNSNLWPTDLWFRRDDDVGVGSSRVGGGGLLTCRPETSIPGKSFALDGSGLSIWSDGTTMWVTLVNDTTVYAYDLATGNRNPARDYPSLLGPLWPAWSYASGGFWSDGRTLWVIGWRGICL